MSNTEKNRTRLINLLKELFQLDQPELDFGLYKIMHAKSVQINRFLENDLLKEIRDAFGEADGNRAAEARAKYEAAIEQARKFGAPNPEETEGVKEAKAAFESAKDGANAESDVYDHLYRFFERYYDSGDFMSRRYYARESESRAAPYAVPYDGREVYLHWANKDQYYIKSSEYLTNYTFDLHEAIRQEGERQASQKGKGQGLDTAITNDDQSLKVHFRIVEASEGKHGNIKAASDQKRFFIIHADKPVEWLSTDEGETNQLIINFQYRIDDEKAGQDNKWQETRLQQAEAVILEALKADTSAAAFLQGLAVPSPTDSKNKRSLLGKYLQKYAARNTMDYFIHKDLGGFLRRELDFYIKNEIMRLDDIENAEVSKVEQYLAKIRVLRRIAQQLIAFLAQLEDFQKKLWLKKKFVTETNYCITLDRIPENFYQDIVINDRQREEWVKLFAIDEIQADLVNPAYSIPLTTEFLKANPYLLVDTAMFDEGFKQKLLDAIDDLDAQCDGILIHSENFQALGLMQQKYREQVKCIYIDPPYNSGGDDFLYKDSFRNSAWLAMLDDRIKSGFRLLKNDGVSFTHIDDKDEDNRVSHRLMNLLEDKFGRSNYLDNLIWVKNTTHNDAKNFSHNHEYILAFSKNRAEASKSQKMFRQSKPGYAEVMELVHSLNPEFPTVQIIENAIRKLYKEKNEEYKQECLAQGLVWDEETKRNDPWKGIKQYKFAEYRLDNDEWVSEEQAHLKKAKIRIYREDNPSWPNANSLTIDHKTEGNADYRFYKPEHPITGKPCPAPARGWLWREKKNPLKPDVLSFDGLVSNKLIAFGENEEKIPQYKRYLHNVDSDVVKSVITDFTDGEKELANILGMRGTFPNPKPTSIGRKLIEISTDYDDYVCDFFGGSGTTAQAVIQQNLVDEKKRKFLIVEMGEHFLETLLPRIKKSVYSVHWKDGRAITPNHLGASFKYLRLESYEDALNNLVLKIDSSRDAALMSNPALQRDYLLNYFLDVETQASQSLLNIAEFRDPTTYQMWIKKPGSDEQTLQAIDLIETFNWLTGLWVEHMAAPQVFNAEFERETDPDLPKDQNTRLICKRLKTDANGDYWFRLIEGYTLKTPGDNTSKVPTLIVWRKQTDDPEQDNAVLQTYLMEKLQISPRAQTYGVIYINGSHTLPNPVVEGEQTKVRLIEEAFHNAMWSGEVV
jgi:adenine-specific DNA-methyltransferase